MVCNIFPFQVNHMLYWWFHFKNELPIKRLFTQWKWTHILGFGAWRWSALNMGYMDKWPSRMQGKFYFLKLGGAGSSFWSGSENFRFVSWGLPRVAESWALAPIHLPLKVRRGRFNIHRAHGHYKFIGKFVVSNFLILKKWAIFCGLSLLGCPKKKQVQILISTLRDWFGS